MLCKAKYHGKQNLQQQLSTNVTLRFTSVPIGCGAGCLKKTLNEYSSPAFFCICLNYDPLRMVCGATAATGKAVL